VWKRISRGCLGALIVIAIGLLGLKIYVSLIPAGNEPVAPISGPPVDLPAGMSRGEYLTRAADCAACHTRQGGVTMTGGRAFSLPFGIIYSTNLTPDTATGIGGWSDDDFVKAVREGVGPHGRLYPAMSYTSFAGMSRDDVLEIKRYLMGLRPVNQPAPANSLAFPFNQRWGMNFWNLLFFRERRYMPQTDRSTAWNRGAYLATALGHCAECHAPRNLAYAMASPDYLSGSITDGWKAYNISSDPKDGIGSWSDDQIKSYLHAGHAQGRSSASGPMAEVVENSLQYLTASDLDALLTYLRALPAHAGGISGGAIERNGTAANQSNAVLPGAEAIAGNARGKRLFEGDCAGCHQWNGQGRETDYASLLGSRAVNDPEGTALVQVLLNGTVLKVGKGTHTMPAFGQTYSDKDVADIANYVLGHFGAKQGQVTATQVKMLRGSGGH
jgi:mono/diheme cytochrome c family protein